MTGRCEECERVVSSHKRFCSESCRGKSNYRKHREYFREYDKLKKLLLRSEWNKPKECTICKKVFSPLHKKTIVCSTVCSKVAWKIRNRERVLSSGREYGKKYWQRTGYVDARKNLKEKLCILCDNKFTPDVRHPYRVACSTPCRMRIERLKNKVLEKAILANPSFDLKRHALIVARKKVQNANYHAIRRGCKTKDCIKHHIHLKDWLEVKGLCGNICVECKVKETIDNPLTIDHVVALANGGHNIKENIQPLCRSCNSSKGNRW